MAQGPNDEQRLLLGEVELGLEVEKFVRSQVGTYLLGRVKDLCEGAVERLKKADPDNPKQIRDIQTEIWRCETFEQFLTDAVIGGRSAEERLTTPQDGDD